MDLSIFASRLKKSREKNRMTQGELAKQIGRSVQTISNWENQVNLPGLETLDLLCDVLDVPSDYLLGRVSYPSLTIDGLDENIIFDLKQLVEHIRKR